MKMSEEVLFLLENSEFWGNFFTSRIPNSGETRIWLGSAVPQYMLAIDGWRFATRK